MLQSVARFTNDATGIEKTLKFVQSFSQVAQSLVASSLPKEAAQWETAKNQANLARRYFRLFKWIDCWTLAYNQFDSYQGRPTNQEKEGSKQSAKVDNIKFILTVSKWSLLGIYLFMEMFTITDAMLITSNSWAPGLQMEALKFWFYSLAVSVLLGVYELFLLESAPVEATTQTPEKGEEEDKERRQASSPDLRAAKRRAIQKRIVADSCDMSIPAAVVGWIPLPPVATGVAGSISAILGGSDVWWRVNV